MSGSAASGSGVTKLRVSIVVLVVAVGTSLTAALMPRNGHSAPVRPAAAAGGELEPTRLIRGVTCGVERWPVKTLSDPQARLVHFTARPATVRYLGSLAASRGGQDSRSLLERRVFGVQARLVQVRREADSDYHLVLSEGGAEMIAEIPLVACTASAAPHRHAMAAARTALDHAVGGPVGESWIHPDLRVHVVGVLFFDFGHVQTGHAPNYAELHPIVGFRVTS
jgi:hypothetical protein